MRDDDGTTEPEEAREHIADILQSEAETRETIKKVERARARAKGKPPTALFLSFMVVMAGLTGWNVMRLRGEGDVFSIERQQAGGEFTVYLTVSALEEYRASRGRPRSLQDIGMDEEDVRYTVQGDRYVIEVTAGGATFTYSSGEDLAPYRAAFEEATAAAEQ